MLIRLGCPRDQNRVTGLAISKPEKLENNAYVGNYFTYSSSWFGTVAGYSYRVFVFYPVL